MRAIFYPYLWGCVNTRLDEHALMAYSLPAREDTLMELTKMELTKTQRRWLASKAQRIKPTVMIGKEGLSEGVTAQTDAELEAHELIKVRFVGHKKYILEIAPLLAKGTNAVLVRTIGHVAVLYRPREDEEKREIVLPRK